jgi:hypothetical protein
MSHAHSWKWRTAIADADRFVAWSRDVAHLQRYMATPGKLLPWEIPVALRLLESGHVEVVRELAPNELPPGGLWKGHALSTKPQLFPPLIIRGPDGTGEPIFTPTEVAFNGDRDTKDSLQEFRITFDHLQAPHYGYCKTNLCSYDILVRCAIVRLAHYFPVIRVFSDGGEAAMKIPVHICCYVFEDETAFPLWAYGDDGEEL